LVAKTGGLFRTRIVLAEAFGDEGEEEIAAGYSNPVTGEPYYVVMRELRSAELLEYMQVPDADKFRTLEGKLQDYIVEHNLVAEGGKTVSAQTVADIIRQSGTLLYHVLGTWQAALPLLKKMQKASAGSLHS